MFWTFVLALALGSIRAAEAPTERPARVKISGFSFLQNRELFRLLRNFQPNGKIPPVIDRTFVEDSVLVLLGRAHDDGYLRASLSGTVTLADSSLRHYSWTNAMDEMLPPDFAARAAHFRLRPGVRFYYHSLEFEGLKTFSKREAMTYFVSSDMLLRLRGNRVYTPAALKSSLAALKETYTRAGYQQVEVKSDPVTWDETTGAVAVKIAVDEGLPTLVRSVAVQVLEGGSRVEENRLLKPGRPYSQGWQQELALKLRAEQQQKGFPDVTVQFSPRQRETNATAILLDLSAEVSRGPLVRTGEVSFTGNHHLKTSALRNRVNLEKGDLLDPVEAEKSRQRLARLSALSSVRLHYETVDDQTRNLVYEVEEGKSMTLSVLAGYGSYERLRGGVEFEDRNLFERGHNLRLRGVQSFKATSGNLFYTVPEFYQDNVNLALEGSGLHREEVSFTREEYGGSLGVQKRLVPLKTEAALRYNYEFLNALNFSSASTIETGVREARAASFILDLHSDRRDNPVLPRRGLNVHGKLEFASASLGGNVDYQRFLYGISYHMDLKGGRLLHLGVIQGVSFTWGGKAVELPFNKRFFPGGEYSVRGYQEGEASPLDEYGKQLGAETYTQANIEFEQLLTRSWSVVSFLDAVGFAQNRSDYPWNEGLYSVGGGIRWRTLIGPVRLEYGYNLNRRRYDPTGTLNFSIGIPF